MEMYGIAPDSDLCEAQHAEYSPGETALLQASRN